MSESIFDNPDLPCYEKEEYRTQKHFWDFVADMFQGRSAWYRVGSSVSSTGGIIDTIKASIYLPQEHAEPQEEYAKRIARSYFDRKFADAIESSASFLTRFTVNQDTHQSILDHLQNVDLCGSSLEVFLKGADIKALRDDHCFILVEFPKRPDNINDARAEREAGLRPYFVLIDARDIPNWDMETVGGRQILNRVTIKETVSVPVGMFGSETRTRYRVLYPGRYEIFECVDEGKEDTALVLIEEGTTTLPYIPLIPYCVTPNDSNPFVGRPPLFDVAELNLKLYQKQSEKDEAMHKANMAVLSVKETQPARTRKENEPPPVIAIGPNTCFWNMDATFVEPSGSALAQTQADIEKLELTIEKKTLAFQSGYYAPPTATEIARDTSTAQASLGGMARAKESAVQQMFAVWADYMNAPGQGGGITVFKKIVDSPMDATRATLLLQIRAAGELTRKSFLEMLRQGEILDKEFDVNQEVATLESEMQVQMVAQQANPMRIN